MAVTPQMRTQVTQLYVSLFGRAPEADGLGYWVQQLNAGKSFQSIAQDMFNVAPARVYYPSYLTNEEIVAKFYVNVLGRTPDAGGLAYWTGRLNTESTTGTAASKSIAVGTVITEMLTAVVSYTGTDAAALQSQSLLNNKVAVGMHYAVDLGGNDIAFASTLVPLVTAGANGTAVANAAIDATQVKNLTSGIDNLTGTTFVSKPAYTPGGTDFVNTLQDEDILIGDGSAASKLSATLGSVNDNAETVITPRLSKITTVDVDYGGGTKGGLNFQDSSGVKNLNITRITSDSAAVTMDNLQGGTDGTFNLSVSNATKGGSVEFLYREESLAGDNTANLSLSNARLHSLKIDETGDSPEDEGFGFETVNVTVKSTSDIDSMTIGANQREDASDADASQTVNLVANGTTEINQLTAPGAETINITANATVLIAKDDRNLLDSGNDGISTAQLTKLTITGDHDVSIDGLDGHIDENDTLDGEDGTTLVVDASTLTADLTLGVATASDGNSSGVWASHADKDVSITSGTGNDWIATYTALAGDISTGAGNDTVQVTDGAGNAAAVEGVSTITTGTGNDKVTAADLLATASDETAGNTTFGEVTAASISTGDGDDTVSVKALASAKDWNNGSLTDSNADDTYFVKGASINTGAGNDKITFTTVAEGASISAGEGNDTVTSSLNAGGTILAADDTVVVGKVTREVNTDGTTNVFGAIVDLGAGDDTATFSQTSVKTGPISATIVGKDAELRAGDGADVLNVTALDAVSVTSATSFDLDAGSGDVNANVFGVETANFTVANQIDLATATATKATQNDELETDGSVTADVMRFDTALKAINLDSQEKVMLESAATEVYRAGTATTFTLNNMREDIALTLKANEATGVTSGALKDDQVTDVNLNVNFANARGAAETFTLNIAQGSGAFDLNLNLGATATDTVGNAASKTDDDDQNVENAVIKLAADDKGHYINFNDFGDASHTEAKEEGSRTAVTSVTVEGGTAGTKLVLDNISADTITAAGGADVKVKTTGSNNFVITTGAGADVINMMSDDVRANDITDDPTDANSVDNTDEGDAVNAGAGNDRLIINGSDNLGNYAGVGQLTDDDVFMKIKSVENLEIQGGGTNKVILDEAAATSNTNLQNIYITGAGAQTTTVQIGNNFTNEKGTLTIDSTKDLSGDFGAAAKSGALTLNIESQDTDQDVDLVNLNVIVGMNQGADVNFDNTGDSKADVTITATVAKNVANTVGSSLAATAGNLSIDVTTGSIDKVVLLDSANNTTLGDNPDNGTITVTVNNNWSKTTFELDASGIKNNDAGVVADPQPAGVRETEGAGLTDDTAAAQVAGIQGGDTGGLIFNGTAETDAKLIVKGTQNDDNITGSGQDDTLAGNDGDDIIVGGNGKDTISGGNGNDDIDSGIGNDIVDAGAGDDKVFGGIGADTLTGGEGKDTFKYTAVTESNGDAADTITDFVSADGDKIVIDGVVAGTLGQDFINLATFAKVDSAGAGDNSLAGNIGATERVLGDAYYDGTQFVIDVDGNGDIQSSADIVIKSTGEIKAANVSYIINAGDGNDIIRGGQGADDLNGGNGADTFVLVGTLSDSEASAYSAAYVAASNDSAAVIGATLKPFETKVLAASELFSSRSVNEVNAGDKINSLGNDASDTVHAFGTLDLSLINNGGALNVGTLVVHSTASMTYAQAVALGKIVLDGNTPHTITLKDDTGTSSDTINAILSKLLFLNQGSLTKVTINAPDGVLTVGWDPVDGRLEVLTDSRASGAAAAGTPLAGLGGAVDLSAPTYANAATKYSLGLTGYTITDTAAAIAAGTSAVLNAANTIAVTDTSVAAATLNTIDGLTSKVVNAASVLTLTGAASAVTAALASTGLSGLGNEAVTLSDTTIAASLLNLIAGQTSGNIDVATVTSMTGNAADVTAIVTDVTIINLGTVGVTVTVNDTSANIQANMATLLSNAKVDVIDSTEDGVAMNLTAAQATSASNMAKLQSADTINVADTSANIQGNLAALLAETKVDSIDSTENSVALTITAAQEAVAANMAKLQAADTITASDTTANLQAALVALLADTKVDNIDSTENSVALTISAAQEAVAANMAKLQTADTITVSDTSANIQANLVALLADTKVDNIDSTENATAFNVTAAQAVVAANVAKLQAGDTITVSDTTANIQTNLAALFAEAKVDNIDSTEDGTAINVTAAQAIVAANVAKLQTADTITVSDTSANINSNLAALFAETKVDNIDSTENSVAINVTSAQAIVAANVAKLQSTDTVTVADTTANIQANLVALFAETKVDNIDSTENSVALTITAAQEGVAANMAKLQTADTVTVSDTSANIQGSLAALLADTKVDNIDSTQNATAINVTAAQATVAANVAKLQATDTIAVVDTGANITAMTSVQLGEAKVDTYNASDDAVSFSVAQITAVTNAKLTAADVVTVADTGANLAANVGGLGINLTGFSNLANTDRLDASDNAVTLTAAQFASVAAGGPLFVAGDVITVSMSNAADVFADLGAAHAAAGQETVKFTNGTASSWAFADVAGAALANTDTFTGLGNIDKVTGFASGTDKIDLTAFALSGVSTDAQFGASNTKVGDGEYKVVIGDFAAGVFTVNAAGADTLVVWDGNTNAASVTMVGVVLVGTNTVTTADLIV